MYFNFSAVSLVQTRPENNQTVVCPGEEIVYTCTTTTGVLQWIPGGQQSVIFNDNNMLNDTKTSEHFTFQLTKKEMNGSMLILTSTATSKMADPSLDGQKILCQDGVDGSESLSVDVPGLCAHYVRFVTHAIFVKLVIP